MIEQKLFYFDFSKYQVNIELFNNDISIVLKEFNFNIKDVENQSALKFNDFNLSFKDKKLSFNLSKILVEFDLLSLTPIMNNIKTNKFKLESENKIHYKYDWIKLIKSFKINIKNINFYLYLSHKSSYLKSTINYISSEYDNGNICIFKNIIDNIFTKYIDINSFPNEIIILNSKRIESFIRVNSINNFVLKTKVDSPLISICLLFYNFEYIQKLSNYFLNKKTFTKSL